MNRDVRWARIIGAVLVASVAATGSSKARTEAGIVIAVKDHASANASIATNDSFVGVVWAARTKEGVTDIYTATSRDGGRSFRSGRLERVEHPDTIADGARTPSLSPLTLAIIRRSVSDMITASDAELIQAMRFTWERMKLIVEPSGAVGAAVVLGDAFKLLAGVNRVGIVFSGGNVSLDKLYW